MPALIIGAVILFAWVLVAIGVAVTYVIIPAVILVLLMLPAFWMSKKMQKKQREKQRSLWHEQMKGFPPEAHFFVEAEDLVRKSFNGVEQKLAIREELRAVADQYGYDEEYWTSGYRKGLRSMHSAGYYAIREAQEKFVMQLDPEKYREILFYLNFLRQDGYADKKGIRGAIEGYLGKEDFYNAMNKYGFIKIPYHKKGEPYTRQLTDEEKLLAIQIYDEGKELLLKYQKNSKEPFPPYYSEWLLDTLCDYEAPEVFL